MWWRYLCLFFPFLLALQILCDIRKLKKKNMKATSHVIHCFCTLLIFPAKSVEHGKEHANYYIEHEERLQLSVKEFCFKVSDTSSKEAAGLQVENTWACRSVACVLGVLGLKSYTLNPAVP